MEDLHNQLDRTQLVVIRLFVEALEELGAAKVI
jgi:hypothetical protein